MQQLSVTLQSVKTENVIVWETTLLEPADMNSFGIPD
jgi:hypothetical protein